MLGEVSLSKCISRKAPGGNDEKIMKQSKETYSGICHVNLVVTRNIGPNFCSLLNVAWADVYPGLPKTPKMESFAKIGNSFFSR